MNIPQSFTQSGLIVQHISLWTSNILGFPCSSQVGMYHLFFQVQFKGKTLQLQINHILTMQPKTATFCLYLDNLIASYLHSAHLAAVSTVSCLKTMRRAC